MEALELAKQQQGAPTLLGGDAAAPFDEFGTRLNQNGDITITSLIKSETDGEIDEFGTRLHQNRDITITSLIKSKTDGEITDNQRTASDGIYLPQRAIGSVKKQIGLPDCIGGAQTSPGLLEPQRQFGAGIKLSDPPAILRRQLPLFYPQEEGVGVDTNRAKV